MHVVNFIARKKLLLFSHKIRATDKRQQDPAREVRSYAGIGTYLPTGEKSYVEGFLPTGEERIHSPYESELSAAERREKCMKGFQDSNLPAKARIWP